MRRRHFLADSGFGFAGLAASTMLACDGVVKAGTQPPHHGSHFTPAAKSVIWIFLSGGYSHMETFDPKPALTQYAGKTYADTPWPNPVESPLHKKILFFLFDGLPNRPGNVARMVSTVEHRVL